MMHGAVINTADLSQSSSDLSGKPVGKTPLYFVMLRCDSVFLFPSTQIECSGRTRPLVPHQIIDIGNQPLPHIIGLIEKVGWPWEEMGDLSPGA